MPAIVRIQPTFSTPVLPNESVTSESVGTTIMNDGPA